MTQSFIYIISPNDNTVKIGYSQEPTERLGQLQVGHDQELILHYTRSDEESRIKIMEQVIHHELRHKKIRGEWFALTPAEARAEVDHAFMRYEDFSSLPHSIKSSVNLRRTKWS